MANALNEITVIQLNINSIQSKTKRAEFQHFLQRHKPHLILLCETKLNKQHKLAFSGYNILRNDRTCNSGGGTAICYSSSFVCEHLSTPSTIKSFECCLLKLKLNDNKSIIVASIYKPPSKVINNKSVPIKINPIEINDILNIDRNAYYIVGGDFNSHHTSWNSAHNCSNGKEIFDWFLA